MAEKRKRRRQSTSLSEQPNSEQISSQTSEDESSGPSCVSMKDDRSMYEPPVFSVNKTPSSQMSEAESSAPSCVSMKDDRSMGEPLVFGVNKTPSSQMSEDEWMKDDASMDEPIMFSVNKTPSQLTEEPHRKKLRKDPEYQRDTEEDAGRSHFLKAKKNLQNAMEKKFTLTFEGNGDQENSMNSIYTTLDITTAETEGKHEEQSFRHTKQPQAYEHSVDLRDIFKPLPGQKTPVRTVLTKGVAGIGKSFSVQKFILDWAEGRENQDVDFVFNVAFRELNLSKDDKSLHQLLTELHPAVHDLKDAEDLVKAKVIVILDGLDESRLQLDFKNKRVTSVSEVTSVGNLLANLIQGNLLHDAKLWITSRPAAANQIPAEFVDMVTEIRGFSDPQKEEYFRRRFLQDVGLADRIISHIRSSQSLDIMCQILIFCWIAAVLFKEIFGGDEKAETPQTLTEMMAYFLFTQTKRRSRKYDQKTNKERLLKTHKEFPLKLGKLAFLQLQKNNLIFYDEDLEECGIDVQEAAVYSGFCTSVLREEQVFSQKKVLSPDSGINLFQNMVEMRDHKVKDEILEFLKSSDRSKTELTPLHCSALAYMLQVSKNDLDVLDLKRFNTSEEGRRRLIPAVRSSRKAKLADCKVNEEWIKHLAFGLKFPYLPLRDLDLSNNDLKDSGVELLCDGLSSQCCRLKTLRLSGCQITEVGCGSLASTLRSKASQLVKLDLSYNHPGESGKKLLSELRDDTEYKLSKLNLDHDGSHRMQPGFKKYACELTLDPNTAHKNLLLSEGNRKVTWVEDQQPYPHRLERFDNCQQVLCDQGLEERCYWEVEVTEPFNIGLTYRTIDRKGDGNDRKLGRNDKSWCMSCSKDGCFVWHNNKSVDVFPQSSRSSKLGVYLDWPAGTLSFYRVSSDSPILIHTFHGKFKEPLYPAVELQPDSSALFC